MQIEYNSDALPSTQTVSDNKKPKIKYEIKDYLSKGTYLDAKDSSGTWYAAYVIEMLSNEKVYVGFDGWIEKWNEVYPTSSKKLQPFRKITQGYTGPSKVNRPFQYSVDELLENKSKVEKILKINFEGISCFHITQLLRGKLFFYLDSLLSYEYAFDDINIENFSKILDYIFLYIKFCCHFIEKFKSLYSHYAKGESNNELFLSDAEVALSLCLYEIVESLIFIFCGNARSKAFYNRHFKILDEIHESFPIVSKYTFDVISDDQMIVENQTEELIIPKIIIKFVNYFGECNGFQNLIHHISSQTAPIPFKCLEIFLKLLNQLVPFLSQKLQIDIYNCLKIEIPKRFSNLSDKEIKDVDKEFLMKILTQCQIIMNNLGEKSTVDEMVETIELDLSYKFLISQYFEKRLKGINSISEIAEKIEYGEKYGRAAMSKISLCRYLNSEIFLKWIREKKIIEILLGDSLHVEILKRSQDLFKFLCKRQFLMSEIVNEIWKACEGKHDSITRTLYDILIVISSNMTKEALATLYKKLKSIDFKNYNELILNLLKEFCENVVNLTENSKFIFENIEIGEDFIEEHFFGVNILWTLILDENPLSPTLNEEALLIFKNLIFNSNFRPLRKYYLMKSIKEIEKGSSIPQSIFIIMKIIQTNYSKKIDNETQIKSLLFSYEKNFSLLTLIMRDLVRYFNKIKTTKQEIYNHSSSIFDEYFEGKHSHKRNIEMRLSLLEYFVSHNLLDENHLETLWEIFVLNAMSYQESVMYFKWLAKQNENAKGEFQIILNNKALIFYQFRKILCDPAKNSFKNMREESFNLFYLFFLMVNGYERVLRFNKNGKLVISSQHFQGLNVLWQIFNENENDKVIEKCADLLTDLHLRISSQNPLEERQKKKETAEKFTTYVMDLIKNAYNQSNKLMINKSVYLLIMFFEKFEGKFFKSTSKATNNYYHFLNATVILKPENIQKEIRINIYDQIGNFRKKISEEFEIPLNQIRLMRKSDGVGDSDDDEMTLREFGLGGVYLICKKKNDNEENYHPKHLISESQEYLDLLFRLLSDSQADCLNNIWNLLMKLPSNEKLKNSFLTMEKTWEELIDINSFYKCLYCLQIVEELTFTNNQGTPITDKNLEEYFENDWHLVFINTKGLEFFMNLFLSQKSFNFQNPLMKKFVCILLKILFFYQKRVNINEKFQENPLLPHQIATKLLETIYLICEYTLIREKNNLENCYNEKENLEKISQTRRDFSKFPQFFVEEADILFYCQEFLLSLINCSVDLLHLIYEYPYLLQISINGLILSDNVLLKEKFSSGLIDLFKTYNLNGILLKPHDFFVPIFMNHVLDIAFQNEERSDSFFNLLIITLEEIKYNSNVVIMSKSPLNYNFSVDFYSIVKKLINFIKETKNQPEKNRKDFLLTFSLNLIHALLNYLDDKIEEIGIDLGFVDELLLNCLFVIRKGLESNHSNYKCKTNHSRMAAFELLRFLAIKNEKNLKKILDFFIPLLRDSDWRTKSNSDWNITPKINEKSQTGYVGLKNLGCICYMNSLTQQLFMIPSFRNFVLEVEDKNQAISKKDDNVLYQLKCMFLSLKESEKQFYNPRYFCHAFKDWDGNPTNVYEQRDVDEYFNMLMDKLENLIKGTSHENSIKNTFGGFLSNEFICKDCPHYSEREEPFLAVSLQVKNKKTLEESLRSFVEGEVLEGQNAYLCEQCNKKVTAIKRICLKKLPNHLILVLKRFEFDYDTMTKVKINDSCEFPMRINMEKYTQYGLRKQENKTTEEDQEKFPPGYFDYELKGLVIHMGIADSGHYYSLIQDREGTFANGEAKWYEFNDTFVSYFDPRDIPNEAYGGEEKWSYFANSNTASYKEKIKNAYLLFYDRVTSIKTEDSKIKEEKKETEEATNINIEEKIINNSCNNEEISKISNPLEEFYLELIESNFKFHIHRNIFSQEFFRFMTSLLMGREYLENRDYLTYPYSYDLEKNQKKYFDLEMLKLGIIFLFTCIIREKERNSLVKFLPFMVQQIKKNLPLCLWFIDGMANKQIIEEFFLFCPIPDMRKFMTGTIRASCSEIWKHEERDFDENDKERVPVSILKNFVNSCINLVQELRTKSYDATEFFKLFYHFYKISNKLSVYMIQNNLILYFLHYFNISIENSANLPKSSKFILLKTKQNPVCLLGQPKEIQKKFMTKLDELKQKKKEKFWMENNNTNRMFMWRTISHLLLFYRFNKNVPKNPLQIGDNDFELSNFEKNLIMGNHENILNILNDANYKISVNAATNIFATFCYEELKLSEFLMKAILKGFRERDVNAFRPYFAGIKKLLQIKDSVHEKRVEQTLMSLMEFMKDNSRFFQDAFYQHQFIFKIAGKIEAVRNFYAKYPETISWIIDYISEIELPNLNSNSIIKFNALRFNRFIIPKNFHDYREFCQDKMLKIKNLMSNEYEKNDESWDSDDDFLEYNFQIGENLDFYHQNLGYWITGKVEKYLEELINFSLTLNEKTLQNTIWKSNDCDDLAPYQFMQDKGNEVTHGVTIEMDTKDSTEKNVGSNDESESEHQMIRNANSVNTDPENPNDILNTTNET